MTDASTPCHGVDQTRPAPAMTRRPSCPVTRPGLARSFLESIYWTGGRCRCTCYLLEQFAGAMPVQREPSKLRQEIPMCLDLPGSVAEHASGEVLSVHQAGLLREVQQRKARQHRRRKDLVSGDHPDGNPHHSRQLQQPMDLLGHNPRAPTCVRKAHSCTNSSTQSLSAHSSEAPL